MAVKGSFTQSRKEDAKAQRENKEMDLTLRLLRELCVFA
jgi:hypothetical protein